MCHISGKYIKMDHRFRLKPYVLQTVLLYGILPLPMFALGALWLYSDISGTMKVRTWLSPHG